MQQYPSEAPLDKLPTAGLSADYVRRETSRAVAGVGAGSKTKIWPGIDIDIPTGEKEKKTTPDDVYAAVKATFEAGAHGIMLSRKYSEMRLDNLRAAGRAIRETVKRAMKGNPRERTTRRPDQTALHQGDASPAPRSWRERPRYCPAEPRPAREPARRCRGTGAPIAGARPTSPRRIRSATTSPGGAATGSAPQVQAVIINAGGIVAYYPSKFPLHHRAEFLSGRDLFGELTKAAHDDGIFVMARMDSNRTAEDFFKAHPDWFARDVNGKPYRAADKYIACINSPYYDEYLPDVLREIIERSHPDGFTDNSWAGLGRESICYCDNCDAQVPGEDRAGAAAQGRLGRSGLPRMDHVELRAPASRSGS